jgi:sodium transport system permease protein
MSSIVVARKELLDHVRDGRALTSTGLYALMGPIVVWLVLTVSAGDSTAGSAAPAIPVMAAVFTLVSAFTGGMSVTMDMIAGERERRSLLPLLVNAVPRLDILVGKWLTASAFALGASLTTLLAFAVVFVLSPAVPAPTTPMLLMVPPLIALALLAAALEILVSALCRTVKEANTYLSILLFVVMGLGMWLAFSSRPIGPWWLSVPIAGHQHLLEIAFVDGNLPLRESALLGVTSIAVALLLIAGAARFFQRDAIIYGD